MKKKTLEILRLHSEAIKDVKIVVSCEVPFRKAASARVSVQSASMYSPHDIMINAFHFIFDPKQVKGPFSNPRACPAGGGGVWTESTSDGD